MYFVVMCLNLSSVVDDYVGIVNFILMNFIDGIDICVC